MFKELELLEWVKKLQVLEWDGEVLEQAKDMFKWVKRVLNH